MVEGYINDNRTYAEPWITFAATETTNPSLNGAVLTGNGAGVGFASFLLGRVDNGYTAEHVLVASVELPRGATEARTDLFIEAALARLREECMRAKEALSSDPETAIRVVLPGLETELPLSREDFEGLIRPRID